MATILLQSTVTQGNYADAFFDVEADPAESGFDAIDPGLYYVDQDSGQIYTREAEPGDSGSDGSWVAQGKLLPFVGDQQAPSAPTNLQVTASTGQLQDGTTMPGFDVQWIANGEDDVIGYHLEADPQVYNFATESYDAATFATPKSWNFGVFGNPPTEGPYFITGLFVAGVPYDFRLAAVDAEGFHSAWSSTVSGVVALRDDTAPEVPTNPTAIGGFRLMGVRWDKANEADLWFYQVRYYQTSLGVGEADYIRTNSSSIIIKDLTPDVEYTVQVRAVDRSGNVATSENDLTGIDYQENDESGWSATTTATPTLIGAGDVAFNSVMTAILSANQIDASTIKTGTLSVGGSANPGAIEVYDTFGRSIASLNEGGYVMVDPDDTSRAVWLTAGYIYFTDGYTGDVTTTTWTTGVSAEGINASAILFGTAEGGANAVPNAGFELSAFVSPTSSVYTDNTDWSGATSTVNMNVSTTHLTMTGT